MATREQMAELNRVRLQLEQDKQRYINLWKDIAKYIDPYYGDFADTDPLSAALPSVTDIYDSTAMKASNKLSDGLQGYACGRTIDWFRLAFEDEDSEKNDSYRQWLQESEKLIYKQFRKSNFYDESRTFIKCGADFGTAVMLRDENPERGIPYYKTIHPKNVLIEENSYGEVDTLFIKSYMSTIEAKRRFGEANLPDPIKLCEDTGKMWSFFHYIGPSDRYELDIPGTGPYISAYWAECQIDKTILEERYNYKPFYVWRWARAYNGEVWGVDAPGMLEVSNVKQLQSMQKDKMRLSQLIARPPIKRTEGLPINFYPGGITDVTAGQDFAPQNITGSLEWLAVDIDRLQRGVNESYYTDLFLILSQNIDKQKTAYETSAIREEKSALLTAFFSRLSTEFFEPVIEDAFSSELIYQRLPAPPVGLEESSLHVDFVSPLAMMQKTAHELSTGRYFMSEVLQIAPVKPDIIDVINFDQYVRNLAESRSVDKTILFNETYVDNIRSARAESIMQEKDRQNKLEEAKTGAEVASKLGGQL